MRTTIAVTGHRPDKLFGYDLMAPGYGAIRTELKKIFTEYGCAALWTGMALGIDQLAALAVLDLNDAGAGITLKAAIPCQGHSSRWPERSRLLYDAILSKCQEKITVTPEPYAAWMMQKRNEYMVDRADLVVAVWDGGKNGGTWNCVNYALKKDRPVLRIDPRDPSSRSWPGRRFEAQR